MPQQDTSQIKEKIISTLESQGPNFPSPIASEIQSSILFTSAFLSELLSEKRIKITNMKVGSSPIYYISGQESQLEPLATKYLKSKEKDAFILLKENQILKDSEQTPPIRVALRSIKDFAIPEEKNDGLYWKYFLTKKEIPEPEAKKETNSEQEQPKNSEEKEIPENEVTTESPSEEKHETPVQEKEKIEIFDKEKPQTEESQKEQPKEEKTLEQKTPQKTPAKKATKKSTPKKSTKKSSSKADEKFFNKVKEYLAENNEEISDIIGFSKSDLILKIRNTQNPEKEYLLVAYNKKRLGEKEITDAFKKSEEHNLPYSILSLGEPTKKMNNFIEAIKKVEEIKKIEN